MDKKYTVFFCALILVSISSISLATGVGIQDAAKPPEAAETGPKCLDCHGPYDKLAKDTADFTMPSGEVVTPHQYVPHDEKEEENIPKCTECHAKHEIPLLDKSTVVKPNNVNYCYQSCHHANNFQPCSACH